MDVQGRGNNAFNPFLFNFKLFGNFFCLKKRPVTTEKQPFALEKRPFV